MRNSCYDIGVFFIYRFTHMSTRTELLLQRLLGEMMSNNARELHLLVGQQPVLRKDGLLQKMSEQAIVLEDFVLEIVKGLLNEDELKTLEMYKEATVMKEISSLGRFRVNVYYQRGVLSLTCKYVSEQILNLSELGLPAIVQELVNEPKGLIIVSGPFDSGRSSLVASMLQEIMNRRPVRVMTLENPLEFLLTNKQGLVEQRHVGKDVVDVKTGLTLLTQEDVEVVYVSDIEKTDSVENLINTSLSDRLVFTTVTSDSAVRAIEMLNVKAGDNEHVANTFADALHAVLNIRLLPRQGTPGRILAVELLLNTPPMQLAMRDRDYIRMQNILQTSKQDDMIMLDQSLLNLVNSGHVAAEHALAIAHDPDRLEVLLKK